MQQQQAVPVPFYYSAPTMYGQDNGSTAHSWVPDKPSQPFNTWENNSGFHMTGSNNLGPGPGPSRQVGPQQQQQPQQQPPPTSTPPGLHAELNKPQVLGNQQGPMGFVQARPMNPYPGFSRPTMQQAQPLRHRNTQIVPNNFMPLSSGVLAPAPAQAIVQAYPAMMFGQTRPGAPYPNNQYLVQQQYYQPGPPPYYPQVLPQFPQMGGGGAPAAGNQASVSVMRPQIQPPPGPAPVKPEQRRRPNAIKIIDPTTNEEIPMDIDAGGNGTPSQSNDSSARETPQPVIAGPSVDNNVAADFAAKVAQAIAKEPTSSESQPDEVDCDSETVHHKQPVGLSHTSEEFVPRLLQMQANPPVPPVPTVSAETSAPAVDIQSPARLNKRQAVPISAPPAPTPVPTPAPVPATVPAPPAPVDNGKSKTKHDKHETVPPPKERREKRSVSKEQSPVPTPAPVPVEAPVVIVEVPVEVPPPQPPVSISKVQQHHNGIPEAPVSTIDSNKTSKGKSKKGKNMRDLNRKGVDKEGSDMDAFTTEPTIVAEERVERPASPAPLPPTPAPVSVPLPSPAVPLDPLPAPRPPTPADKIQEDMLEKEPKPEEPEEEDAVVAPNNLEPAISKPEEDKPVVQQLTLRHSYKKDQWSPLNPEGKKKYDRDFLMDLKSEPQSNQKPDKLPDVVAVIRDSSNNMRNQNMSFMNSQSIFPSFVQRNSQSQRGPPPKRGSQQGNKGKNPKVIHMTLSLNDDVKLKTSENAWKPQRLDADIGKPEEAKQTEELYKMVRGILNKLTPQKFETLMKKFKDLKIDSEERLTGVINLIFDKAVDEPNFAKCYANMCKICIKLEVPKIENGVEQRVNFRKVLITRCQTEFESSKPAELDSAKHMEEIKNCTDPEQKKELMLAYEEKERAIRMKSVGNIRFIGELFKLGMLTPTIMQRCIEHLLKTPEEESLECLCKLLTTIGRDLESQAQNNPKNQGFTLNPYFQKMQDLTQRKEGSKVSSRVRFMLQDVIELRQNRWVPRREDNNPKTIDQITKEAERESMEITLALSQQPQRLNRPNDRQDDRGKRNNRGNNNNNINNNNSDGGWATVTRESRHNKQFNTAFEASKMQNVKSEVDINSLSLGGSQQFRFSAMNNKTMENKPGAVSFTTSNLFSPLSRGEDRKPPQSGMNSNRRITPTPSIERDKERERQRMIQGVESEGRSSRGSSVQRGPPSRDSSVPPSAPTVTEAPAVVKSAPVDPEAARLAEEKLERKTIMILEEYITGVSPLEDVKQEMEQIYTPANLGMFVEKALQFALERKAGTQRIVGQLLAGLMDQGTISPQVLVEQLRLIYEMADDIAIDVPKVWELQAQTLVPILLAEKINYGHLRDACSAVLKTRAAAKLLAPTLTLLAQEKSAGPAFVRKLWDSSNVSLKDFLPQEQSVDAFIKENSLEYLTGEPPKFDSSSNQLSMEQVKDRMHRLMMNNQSYEKIHEFISSNVGDKVEDLHFIRALITSICEACITGSNALDSNKLNQYKKLIQRFVDNKEDRELAAITAVHMLMSRLEHPSGLINTIFNNFLDDNLISSDSFLKWRDDKENIENKGVSVYALTSFFAALEEVETDEETS
ncbi:eukaryotic translation initiation factor 4 gamma 1-like isoform X3 [Homalodisca vitripennis]|uniref:eukaryotic translation initiation factor 4 gamma 1-like isoform X3 n=1 Tax=Homalodisca vitripennis TaxID=197043 RepID=UPI001EEAE74E|nr:eukaryotic translation initiation factor 4 gamma 1-like isoform X3 [Homalodisca vitripennis]